MNERHGHHNGGDFAPRRDFRRADRSPSHPPPEEGSIWEGKIQRIQPYGAFCSFGPLMDRERQRRAWQGLIHISQLLETRVEKVEDVVDVDDTVWVKILEVEKQPPSDQHTNARFRIKLSMKEVSQDGTGQDLGREREAKEQVTTQLQTNLNSMIGMGVALDPMERLVLKNSGNYGGGKDNASSKKATFRGGYTLVGDDEGEPEPEPSTAATDTTNNSYRTAPMGRGRGATLPAWMTSSEGPVGASSNQARSRSPGRKVASDDKADRDKYRDYSDDDDRSRKRKKEKREDRKRHKKKSKHRRHKRSHDYSDDESSDSSLSGLRRRYDDDDERRHRKRYKSSRRHGRKDNRKSSSKRKDKKKRKRSRHEDKQEKDDRRSRDDASISDSYSSYSSR